MKVLLLLRHADSVDKLPGQEDKQRPLSKKGISQCFSIASFLKEKELIPDCVIASDAARVRATLDAISKHHSLTMESTYLSDLYEGDTSVYLNAVQGAPDCQTLLVAGHNPGVSAFASFISKTAILGMGTGNLLVFQFKDDSWSSMNKSQCELMEHFAPQA